MDEDLIIYPISVGQKVPDMEFEVYYKDEGKKVKFSDFHRKWLIVFFYPADFTFICPTELEEMADMYKEFQKEGTEVLSVSTDTIFTHKAWHDTSDAIKKIEFPMAADPSGKISRLFGTFIEDCGNEFTEDEGKALRGTFIINPEGVVQSVEINSNNIGRSAKELFRKLQAAKYVSEHSGKVCPASWTPGDDTLEPGMDLVGKI